MKNQTIISLVALLLVCTPESKSQPARPAKTQRVISESSVTNSVVTTNQVTGLPVSTNIQIATTSVSVPVLKQSQDGRDALMENYLILSSGFILLDPYSISTNGLSGDIGNRRALEKSDGTEAKFFISVGYNHIWAWDTDRRGDFAIGELKKGSKGRAFWKAGEWPPVDFQVRLSYYGKDDEETTASAIVGSGSFGAEFNLGVPFYRWVYTFSGTAPTTGSAPEQRAAVYEDTKAVHWFGGILSYSAVTDSDAFELHDRWLLGVGYRGALRGYVVTGDVRREIVLSMNVGAASVESVEFLNNDSREIRMDNGDIPHYQADIAFAIETEVYVPVTTSVSAVLGSRLYSGLENNTWNAYLGLTIPADKIAALFR